MQDSFFDELVKIDNGASEKCCIIFNLQAIDFGVSRSVNHQVGGSNPSWGANNKIKVLHENVGPFLCLKYFCSLQCYGYQSA